VRRGDAQLVRLETDQARVQTQRKEDEGQGGASSRTPEKSVRKGRAKWLSNRISGAGIARCSGSRREEKKKRSIASKTLNSQQRERDLRKIADQASLPEIGGGGCFSGGGSLSLDKKSQKGEDSLWEGERKRSAQEQIEGALYRAKVEDGPNPHANKTL